MMKKLKKREKGIKRKKFFKWDTIKNSENKEIFWEEYHWQKKFRKEKIILINERVEFRRIQNFQKNKSRRNKKKKKRFALFLKYHNAY